MWTLLAVGLLLSASASQVSRFYPASGINYQSKWQLQGIPLIDLRLPPQQLDGETSQRVANDRLAAFDLCTACGFLAIGPLAVGVIAIGGVSVGVVSIGICTLGFAIGCGVLALAAWKGMGVLAIAPYRVDVATHRSDERDSKGGTNAVLTSKPNASAAGNHAHSPEDLSS